MPLSYVNELTKYFFNLSNIDVHTSFLKGTDTIDKLIAEDLPFCFGTSFIIITKNGKITGETNTNNPMYIPIFCDLLFGFYTDADVEFDIYVDNKFKYHYILTPNKFTYLKNENGDIISAVSLNMIEEHLNLEIRNVKTEAESIILRLLFAYLDRPLRSETGKSKLQEIVLIPNI